MLSRYNPIDIERALRAGSPEPPFPPAWDRAAWKQVAASVGANQVAALMSAAEEAAHAPVPALTATLYLEYTRKGQREGYEVPRNRRREMLTNLALAECLEYKGRFLDRILDLAWIICEESSWALPAHSLGLADLDHPVIDLGAAMTALELAELDHLLGRELEPALSKRIRNEIDRRCIKPFLSRHDHWWLYDSHLGSVDNWTAVCNAGVVGAAIYLEKDMALLAEIIARAARSLDDYLNTFDPDGGSSEGPLYWSYGFGYYTILAHLVEHRTSGQVTFLDEELIPRIACFPLRTVLSPGRYVNFSDCDASASLTPAHLAYLSQRLAIPELMQLAREQLVGPREWFRTFITWGLRALFWRPLAEPAGRFTPAPHDWFSGMMWMLARYNPEDPDALVLAAKGGHNNEMHNQNDVGNIVVHVRGESVVADVGRGRYTREYFGPTRYEHFATSSRGHSVPIPNGCLQLPGREYSAVLLEHRASGREDVLALELKGAYPTEADLASLRRRVVLHREPPRGWVELEDRVRFASRPGNLQSVLITLGQVETNGGEAWLHGERGALRVSFDAERVGASVEIVRNVDLAQGPTDVRRVVFYLKQPAIEAAIRLMIVPE